MAHLMTLGHLTSDRLPLLGDVDDPHASLADLLEDLVGADPLGVFLHPPPERKLPGVGLACLEPGRFLREVFEGVTVLLVGTQQ